MSVIAKLEKKIIRAWVCPEDEKNHTGSNWHGQEVMPLSGSTIA